MKLIQVYKSWTIGGRYLFSVNKSQMELAGTSGEEISPFICSSICNSATWLENDYGSICLPNTRNVFLSAKFCGELRPRITV